MSDARRAKIELGIAVACSLAALAVALSFSIETGLFGEERVLAESSVRVAATAAEGENVTVFEPLELDEPRPIDVHVDRGADEGSLDLGLALVEVDGDEVYETALTSPARARAHAAFGRVAEGRYLLRVEGHWHPEHGGAATTARIRVVEAPKTPALAALFAAALLLPIPIAYARYRRSSSPPAQAGGRGGGAAPRTAEGK